MKSLLENKSGKTVLEVPPVTGDVIQFSDKSIWRVGQVYNSSAEITYVSGSDSPNTTYHSQYPIFYKYWRYV